MSQEPSREALESMAATNRAGYRSASEQFEEDLAAAFDAPRWPVFESSEARGLRTEEAPATDWEAVAIWAMVIAFGAGAWIFAGLGLRWLVMR